jgi:hypothetical protein
MHKVLVIKEMSIERSVNKKFLRLQTDNHFNWKNHIDQMIPKLSGECYAVRLMLLNTLNLCSSFTVKDQISQPYNISKITVHILQTRHF